MSIVVQAGSTDSFFLEAGARFDIQGPCEVLVSRWMTKFRVKIGSAEQQVGPFLSDAQVNVLATSETTYLVYPAEVWVAPSVLSGVDGAASVGTADGGDVQSALDGIEATLDFSELVAATTPVNDADLMILRQGSTNKKIDAGTFRTEFATDAVVAQIAAEVARTAAESAAEASFALGPKYTTEALGRAAVANGAVFLVVGSGDVAAYEYRRIDSSNSTLIASYPSIDAVRHPAWTGKRCYWPDPYFRSFEYPSGTFDGSALWGQTGTSTVPGSLSSFALVDNPVYYGKALRKTGASDLVGPRITLTTVGLAPGDEISIGAMMYEVAGETPTLLLYFRPYDSANTPTDDQQIATNFGSYATGRLASIIYTIPADTAYIQIFPVNTGPSDVTDLVALWVTKGGTAVLAPPPTDDIVTLLVDIRETDSETDARVDIVEGAVAFGFVSQTEVTGSISTVINGTNFGSVKRDLTFSGWGERYTPAGVSFNALEIVTLDRALVATGKWRTINVVVRTGANAHLTGATVVAVGSSLVDPDTAPLSNVRVLLRHPTTDALITLSDGNFSGSEYFIGVYALDADGAPAACGEFNGTLANTEGHSYYITSSDPKTASWADHAENARQGARHLLITDPVEGTNFDPSQGFADELAPRLNLSTLNPEVAQASAAVEYAFISSNIVTGSSSVEIDGSGFGSVQRDLTFSGWGERYTPADVSFNALEIVYLDRSPTATVQWRTINVVIRTGANSHQAGATVVAVGSSLVNPESAPLANLTILLRDPVTEDLITLDDTSFSGSEYFIGVYARDADDNPAACGEFNGTLANTIGYAYYITNGNPKTATWADHGGNARQGARHLLITDPVEDIDFDPTQAFADELAPLLGLASVIPTVVLPPTIYGMQGAECSLYFDNVLLTDADNYNFRLWTTVAGTKRQYEERFYWSPSGAVTTGALTFDVYSKYGETALVTDSVDLRAAASSAGSGTTKKVIMVGDSLINNETITQTMIDLAAVDAMALTLLGTRGTGANKHEGRSGWSITTYTTNYSDVSYGANPFWIGGAVNFPQYLIDNSIATPDWVFINLGINDVYSQTTDLGAQNAASAAFLNLDTLITSIKAAGAGVKVALMIPPPPCRSEDAFSSAFGNTRWRFKRNILIWAQQLIEAYEGQEASRIYLVPTNTAHDTVNNTSLAASAPVNSRSSVNVTRQTDSVHPGTTGYRQIGDAVWAFLKCNA